MLRCLSLRKLDPETDKSEYAYCFDKQSVYKKFLIVAAGPAFNLILAVIFFTIVHFSGITGMKPFVTSIEGYDLSQVKNNSFHEIIEVNNVETQRWQDVRVEVLNAVVNKTKLNVLIKDRDSNIKNIEI